MEGLNFEIVGHVTRPHLKLETGKEYFVKFESAMREAEESTPTRSRSKRSADGAPVAARTMAPPVLADVIDLTSNRPVTIIINAVMESELDKKYPEDKYVGKSFRIVANQLQGKKYKTFDLAEIRLKSDTAQAPAPAANATPSPAAKGANSGKK